MRIGVAHHLGWAVVVTAAPDHTVVDRRRIELVAPGVSPAPIHHDGGFYEMHRNGPPLDDQALAVLVAEVRASARATAGAELDALAATLPAPVMSISLRDWPLDFPTDVAVLRRPPLESRADSVMYCQVLAGLAEARGWPVHRFDAKTVEDEAMQLLGPRGEAILRAPRATLGPPWQQDHRIALAATIMAGAAESPAPA